MHTMKRHPVGRPLLLACICALVLACVGGCSREEKPTPKTVSSVQAQIDNVQKDTKMPPNIKAMVLGQLKAEMERVKRQEAQGGGK